MVKEEDLRKFQEELWNLTSKYIKPDDTGGVFMCGGAMLHAALQLYTVGLDNESIIKIIKTALETLQPLREDMKNKLKRTLH